MKHLKILVQVPFATSKVVLDIQYKKHCIRLTSRVAERLKTQDLRKSGNIGNMTKMAGGRAQYPVFLPQIEIWYYWSKITQKQISKFSCPFLLNFLTLFHKFCPRLYETLHNIDISSQHHILTQLNLNFVSLLISNWRGELKNLLNILRSTSHTMQCILGGFSVKYPFFTWVIKNIKELVAPVEKILKVNFIFVLFDGFVIPGKLHQ